jgi:hypothetical protein
MYTFVADKEGKKKKTVASSTQSTGLENNQEE